MKKNINVINFIISITFSLLLIFISSNEQYWINIWSILKIPYQLPVFSDADSINKALLSLKQGYNPYIENPNDISGSKYIYPKTWLYIFEFLNLSNQYYFKAFCFFTFTLYFYSILDIAIRTNSKLFYAFVILFLISKINLLLLERLNIDIVIFVLCWLIVYFNKFFVKAVLYIFSFSLKIYPFFSILLFIESKKKFYFILTISILLFVLFKDQILLIKSNLIPYAMLIAYGFETLARGVYHYSINFNLFISDDNYLIFKNIFIFFGGIYSVIIFILSYRSEKKLANTTLNFEEKAFLVGGGIYVGTYLVSTNIDFRLIFLLFTIPLFIKLYKNIYIYLYLFFCLISMNALIFETGNRISLEYVIKSFLIHGMKFYIYTFIIFHFGKILKRFIEIRFIK